MALRAVEQPAIVVLAVDLDQPRHRVSRSSAADTGWSLIAGAAAAIGLDDAAHDQRFTGLAARGAFSSSSAAIAGSSPVSKLAVTTAWRGAVPHQPDCLGALRRARGRAHRAGSTCPRPSRRSARRRPARKNRARAPRSARRRGWRASPASACALGDRCDRNRGGTPIASTERRRRQPRTVHADPPKHRPSSPVQKERHFDTLSANGQWRWRGCGRLQPFRLAFSLSSRGARLVIRS